MKKRIGILFLAFLFAVSTVSATATELFMEGESFGEVPLEEVSLGDLSFAEIDLYDASSTATLSTTDPIEKATLLIEEGIQNMDAEIVLYSSGVTVSDLSTAVARAMHRNPRFFYVAQSYGYRSMGSYAYSVVFTYTMTEEEIEAANAEIDAEIEAAVATTNSSMNDAEKALAAHDYICAQFEYDVTYTNYDIYTFVRDRQGVCQAYAYLYMDILEELGIPCEFVPSDSMVHAWNLVEIDGEWYHVDVTYDDPIYDLLGLAYHRYFLLDDATMQDADHNHTGYVTSHEADDPTYVNRAWTGNRSPFVNINGVWYTGGYENYTTYLYSYDFERDTLTEVYEGTTWNAFSGGFYPASYMGIFEYEDTVLFNLRDGFYQYDPEDETTQKIYEIEEEGAWVYGSRLSGDTVWYATTTSPNHGHMNSDAPENYEIHSISLEEIAPCDATLSLAGGTSGSGSVTIENGTYVGRARLIVAGYDGDNRLTAFSALPVTLTLRDAQNVPYTLAGSGFHRVKAMLLTTDGITPLAVSVE